MPIPRMDSQTFNEYAYHLLQAGDKDKLYDLLSDEARIQAQVEQGHHYAQICEALQYGLQAYVDGTTAEDDRRLCYLALQTAYLATQDIHDMSRTMHWAREGQLEQTLGKLVLLNDENFYKSALLLLWNEAFLQRSLPAEKQSDEQARRLWQEVDNRLGERPIAWDKWLPEIFLVLWGEELLPLLPLTDIIKMVKRGGEIESDRVLAQLAVRFAASGKASEAFTTVGHVASDWQKYQALVAIAQHACIGSQARQAFAQSLELCDRMDSDWEKHRTLAGLAQLLALKRDALPDLGMLFDSLVTSARRIESTWAQCETVAQIALSLDQSGSAAAARRLLDEALATAEAVSHGDTQCSALSAIAQAWSDLGDEEAANRVLEKALHISENLDEDYRDEALSAIAQAIAHSGDIPAAMQLANNIQDELTRSNVLLAITSFLVHHGNFAEALEIIPTIRMEQVKSDALSAIAQALAHAGNLEKALSYVPQDDNRSRVLVEIVRTLLAMGQAKNALQIMKRIPHVQARNQAIADCMRYMVENGKQALAMNMASQLPGEDELQAHLYIAASLQKNGQSEDSKGILAKTLAIVGKWPDSKSKVRILSELAMRMCETGEADSAGEIFVQALKATQSIRDIEDHRQAVWALVEYMVQAPQVKDRLFLLEKALNRPHVLEEEVCNSLSLLDNFRAMGQQANIEQLLALCSNRSGQQHGEYQEAQEWQDNSWDGGVVDELPYQLKDLQGMDNEYEKSFGLSVWAQAVSAASDVADKDGQFARALAIAHTIADERYKSVAISALIQAIVESHDVDNTSGLLARAMTSAASFEEDWHKFSVLVALAQAWAHLGEFTQAMHIAQSMPDRGWQCEALATIALVFAAKGKRGEVHQVFLKILDIGDGLELSWRKAYSFSSVAQALAHVGEFTQALELAQMIASDWNKSEALSAIAQSMSKAGKISHALTITHQIEADADKLSALCAITDRLRHENDLPQRRVFLAQALEVASTMSDRRCLHDTLNNIADALARIGELSLLPEFLEHSTLPPECLQSIAENWQQALVKHLDNPLPALRRALVIAPFDYRLVCHGLTLLQLCHWRLGNHEHYDAVEETMQKFMG